MGERKKKEKKSPEIIGPLLDLLQNSSCGGVAGKHMVRTGSGLGEEGGLPRGWVRGPQFVGNRGG